jgi:hypothetical protein
MVAEVVDTTLGVVVEVVVPVALQLTFHLQFLYQEDPEDQEFLILLQVQM